MHKIFKYLSDQEEHAIMEHGGLQKHGPDDIIVKQGEEQSALCVIKSGEVRVEYESAGFPLEVARLKAGEIFGEMSFVEGSPASANCVADGVVETYEIHHQDIEGLFKKHPDVYGKFYHSLAEILSRRVRETSSLASSGDWQPRQ